jgi:hypothetical protein
VAARATRVSGQARLRRAGRAGVTQQAREAGVLRLGVAELGEIGRRRRRGPGLEQDGERENDTAARQ